MSKIAMQQEALGQLQAGLIDELEAKGTFQNPETQKIMDKYQKVTILANKKIILSACYGRFIMVKVCVVYVEYRNVACQMVRESGELTPLVRSRSTKS